MDKKVNSVARSLRDEKLDNPTTRSRLSVSGKPIYRAIDEGLHIGYRRGKRAGKWVMRAYRGDEKTYRVVTIGTADDRLPADGIDILNFYQAQEEARRKHLASKGVASDRSQRGAYTVEHCIDDYIGWLDQHRKTAKDARTRAEAAILPKLGKVDCEKLTTQQLREWRDAAAEAPARIRTKPGEKQRVRTAPDADPAEAQRRRRATVNRVLTILKAALNQAWRDGKITTDQAWRRVKPFAQTSAARQGYLNNDECKRLLNATSGRFHDLVHAALLTGCRFGELAALQVGDFNLATGKVYIRTSKSGRPRDVVLTEEGTLFFDRLAAGQPMRGILLPNEAGARWGKNQQSRPMTKACEAARIEPPVGFHALRHTYASLSIMGGGTLLVVAHNLGHRDARMVEKHYGHMTTSFVDEAIRAAAPRFGVAADHKVVSLGVKG